MRFFAVASTLLLALGNLQACGGEASAPSDGGVAQDGSLARDGGVAEDAGIPLDAGAATSLDGNVSCGTSTCLTGELCVERASGVDGGSSFSSCSTAPSPCTDLRDCSSQSTCVSTLWPPTCAQRTCSPTVPSQVTGRRVRCMGQ